MSEETEIPFEEFMKLDEIDPNHQYGINRIKQTIEDFKAKKLKAKLKRKKKVKLDRRNKVKQQKRR